MNARFYVWRGVGWVTLLSAGGWVVGHLAIVMGQDGQPSPPAPPLPGIPAPAVVPIPPGAGIRPGAPLELTSPGGDVLIAAPPRQGGGLTIQSLPPGQQFRHLGDHFIYGHANPEGEFHIQLDPGAQINATALRAQKAHHQSMELEQQVRQTVAEYSKTENESGKDDIKDKLEDLLDKQFEVRQELREAELADLEKKVGELKRQISRRRQKQDEIVDHRLQQLLREAEGLGWGGDEREGNFSWSGDAEWTPGPAVVSRDFYVTGPPSIAPKSSSEPAEASPEVESGPDNSSGGAAGGAGQGSSDAEERTRRERRDR